MKTFFCAYDGDNGNCSIVVRAETPEAAMEIWKEMAVEWSWIDEETEFGTELVEEPETMSAMIVRELVLHDETRAGPLLWTASGDQRAVGLMFYRGSLEVEE